MRRKKISIPLTDMPDYIQEIIVATFKEQNFDVDRNTIHVVALEQHAYDPRSYVQFINNIKRYVEINGAKLVSKTELAKIGKISRPTIDSFIKALLLHPAEYYNWDDRDRNFYDLSAENGWSDSCYSAMNGTRYNFDLQKIIEGDK